MELIGLVLAAIPALGFLFWGMSKKTWLSVIAIPPMLMLVLIVMILNVDRTIVITHFDLACPTIPLNSTATVSGNTTTTTFTAAPCVYMSNPDPHLIAPELMLILNFTVMSGMFFVVMVFLRRTFKQGTTEES